MNHIFTTFAIIDPAMLLYAGKGVFVFGRHQDSYRLPLGSDVLLLFNAGMLKYIIILLLLRESLLNTLLSACFSVPSTG